ncbi:membrane steroid-binding protein 1-like [Typha latifolia]|uniref:membrane steroid-binding protein 1-like n=1 Tax=Typha latifolia TaxID=4733 RepID=UPI003C2BE6D5
MAAELWETLKHAIVAYTGLSPAAFFTVVAVSAVFYHVVSGFFAAPPPPPRKRDLVKVEPLPPPIQLGEITEEELKAYDGSDPEKPLLMAVKGQIYDVTQSRMFYGPDGPYGLFAGKDASRALAKMSFEQKDLTGDISGLGPFELDALQDWEYKFMSKYVKVGTIKKAVPATEVGATNPPEASENAADVSTISQAGHAVEPKENGSESHEDAKQARKAEDKLTDLVEEVDAD